MGLYVGALRINFNFVTLNYYYIIDNINFQLQVMKEIYWVEVIKLYKKAKESCLEVVSNLPFYQVLSFSLHNLVCTNSII